MKLLIVTQAIDLDDPILGFFHRWVEELAKRVESVEIICLAEGEHNLPQNVRVHSLGKDRVRAYEEMLVKRLKYSWRFYRLIHHLGGRYDTVLVHMNPEYVVLGGLYWRAMGKRVALWYNHPARNSWLLLSTLFASRIFYTSRYAATATFTRAVRMPTGIDTELFAPQTVPRDRLSLYMQGRITPSKNVHIALRALRELRKTFPVTLTLVGPEDPAYGTQLRTEFGDLINEGAALFLGPKRNDETPALFGAHSVSINLAAAGHFDKSVLESMACGTPVVLSSKAFAGLLPAEHVVQEHDPEALAAGIARVLELSDEAYRVLGESERSVVVKSESLDLLANKLVRELSV